MADTRGYLNENYRLFHITDRRDVDFESHFHDFHKLILCLSGSVRYIMEGRVYDISRGDILLVPRETIHKSILNSTETYERAVFWISDAFLRGLSEGSHTLADCFDAAASDGVCSAAPNRDEYASVLRSVTAMESASASDAFGSSFLREAAFLELMVSVNRIFSSAPVGGSFSSDPKFDGILLYINNNLSDDLSVDGLASKFFISRSYLMHRFKELTGCSVHGYITQKRLTRALELMKNGVPASVAAAESGFADYTVFYRNFKRIFGVAPARIARK